LLQEFKEFLGYKVLFLFVLKCQKNQRKESLWEIGFDLDFNIYLVFFPRIFLCYFLFQDTLFFSHLSYHIYPIYRILF